MIEKLSLWELYNQQVEFDNELKTHGHNASMITGLHPCATTGNAATVNGKTVLSNVPADAKFTDTIYYHPSTHPASMITGLHACATNGIASNLISSNYAAPIEIGRFIDLHMEGSVTDYDYRLYLPTAGAMIATGTFTAAKVFNAIYNDYAEWFERKDLNEKLQAGDILSWDGKGVTKADSNHKNVIGVFSDFYGHIIGGKKLPNMDDNIANFAPVGLSGRSKIKVTGKVNPGDFIILSEDIPGVGVAGEFSPGITVGKALESHSGDSINRISCLIVTI